MNAYPVICRKTHHPDHLQLQLENVQDRRASANARFQLEKCIRAAEDDDIFCEKDGIWLQICHL